MMKLTVAPATATCPVGWPVITGGALMVMTLEAVLLAELGSAVVEPIVTLLVIGPAIEGVTVTVILLPAPPARAPRLQVTTPPMLVQPGDADTKLTLLGNASVRVTADAVNAPRLVVANV